MRTLLTNDKMHPALVARIEASLQRRSRHAGSGIYRPRAVAVGRFLGIAAALAAIVAIYVTQRRAHDRFEARRAALIAAIEGPSASLNEREKQLLQRTEAPLRMLAGPYEGDLVAPSLRASGLGPVLGSPTVYARGLLNDFTGGRSIELATETSTKDAFLFCLVDPPPARDEATLVAKVREARRPELVAERTPAVALLRDAEFGLPFLLPPFVARVRAARSAFDLVALEQSFAQAPVEGATVAARAHYLLAALDEGFGAGLDGDRAHDVRVTVVDLVEAKVLLRLRRPVDPTIVSAPSRPRFSVDVDGCTLALDVGAAVARQVQ